jgi:large subunit ribosomal protein L29
MAEKTSKLRELSSAELGNRLEDARKEYRNLRFQYATGELTDHTRLRQIRHQIARMMTILREREIETEGEA